MRLLLRYPFPQRTAEQWVLEEILKNDCSGFCSEVEWLIGSFLSSSHYWGDLSY